VLTLKRALSENEYEKSISLFVVSLSNCSLVNIIFKPSDIICGVKIPAEDIMFMIVSGYGMLVAYQVSNKMIDFGRDGLKIKKR